jgi:hypothetical protein
MKRLRILVIMFVVVSVAVGGTAAAQADGPNVPDVAVGTAFTYQGRLTDGGVPANGTYDFDFLLYDLPSAGTIIGHLPKGDVTVTNGLFVVSLDFGASAFSGQARYLQIWVRPGSSTGSYTALSPRQEMTATPYALFSTAPWTTSGNDISYS